MPVRVIGRIAPFTDGAFKVVEVEDLGGLLVKSISTSGEVIYQDANDDEQTAQLSLGSGAAITEGTADPSGGAAGDAYIQRNTSNVIVSIWLNIADSWTEYTLPQGGAGTISTSAPVSGDGSAGDPATIENHAISHLKLGSTVAGVNQAAGRITEADGAGGVRWTDQAEGGGGGGDVDEVVSADLGTPEAADVYAMRNHLGEWFRNIPTNVDAEATWTEYALDSDVSALWNEQVGTYTWRGVHETSEIANPIEGDLVLRPNGGFRRRGATNWSHLGNPDGWQGGPYITEDEALGHVDATNEVVVWGGNIQVVLTYTAGTTNYSWDAQDFDKSRLISEVLGTPIKARLYEVQNYLGELYRVEPRSNGHVVAWDDYALLSDVSTLWAENAGTYRWRGETYPSGVTSPVTGDIIKEPAGHFRVLHSSGSWVHVGNPENWIGDYNTEEDADHHVTAVDQTALYSHILHQVNSVTLGVVGYIWAKGMDAREVIVDAHAFGGNLATTDTDIQSVADKVDGLILGATASDDAPEDIGDTAAAGDGEEYSPHDHVHRLPIDNTLEYDDANEQFGVNVHDVIEHLQERIRYFTTTGSHTSDAGASVGQAYTTSTYRKIITKVNVEFAPLSGADEFLVRLVELEDNNEIKTKLFTSDSHSAPFPAGNQVRAFRFYDANGDPGVTIDGNIRLGILLSRLGDNSDSAVQAIHGSLDSDSPDETYDDASTDFALVNGVVYQHIDPAVGASTHSHDSQSRGNIRIFYTLIVDHGNLVGDGNVNAAHIDSESADDGQVLTADGAGAAAWEDVPSGGGAITQATESDLGGVRGATATQAIANSGTTILGWSNNRLRQLNADALPTMVQTDIDNATTDRKAITGALIAANAGGGGGTDDQTATEVPVTATGFTGNLSSTDTDVQAALDTIDGFSLGSGTSTALPDFFDAPIEDVANIDVSNTTPENYLAIDANNVITNRGGFTIEIGTNTHQAIKVPVDGNYTITAVTSILQNNTGVPRNRTRFQFFIVRAGVDIPAAGSGLYATYGRFTVPAGFADGSYTVDLLADDQIEMRYSDELATTATYTLGGGLSRIGVIRNSGGGGDTSEEQTAGSAPRERDIVGTNIPLGAANANTAWNGQGSSTLTFPATPRDDMDRIEFAIDVDNHYTVPFVLTAHQLEVIGGGALGTPTDGATRIQCAFWAGRTTTSSRNRGIVIHEPRLDFCNERRNANDICLMIHPQFNADQDWVGITIRVRAPTTSGHQFVWGKVYDWGGQINGTWKFS